MKNKIIRQFLTLLLAVVLVSTSAATFHAAAVTQPDLTAQQMLQDPSSPITKGEFARLINTYFGLTGDGGDSFNDVSADDPYAPDIALAKSTGYYSGDGNGNVNPDKVISGAEASMVVNFFLVSGLGFDLSKVDVDASIDVPSWAKPAASNLVDLAMVSKDLVEKQQLTVEDANNFATAAYTAVMFMGSPYDVSQAAQKDDFYGYTNRQFLATATVTAGNVEVSNITNISDQVKAQLASLVNGIVSQKTFTAGSDEWKITQIFNIYMDNDARTKSLDTLTPVFDDIKAAKTISDLDSVGNKYIEFNFQSFYSIAAYSDAKVDALKWAAFVLPGSFGLPLAYYTDNAQNAPIQKAFRDFIAGILKLAGETDNLDKRAQAIYDMAKSTAQAQMPAAQLNNPSVLYTSTTWDDMNPIIKHGISWTSDQKTAIESLPVYCPDKKYIQFVNSLYTEANLQTFKDIAMMSIIGTLGSVLGDNYLDLADAMNAAALGSAPARDPVEVRAMGAVTSFMEPALSNMYAAKYGTQKVKDDMTNMVETIRQKRIDRINDLDWMSADTKTKAIDKLKSITAYVAYPDKPVGELNFDVTAKASGGNLIDLWRSMAKAQIEKGMADLQKPIDQNMWNSVPTYTVNAYYNPSVNGIIIPIGILQAPIYDPNGTQEENLGSIGAIIAHEFTHSVDNNGAQYDKNGTLTNWWTDADYAAFTAKTKTVSGKLSQITFDGQKINGDLCAAEAIADLGGLSAVLSVAEEQNLDAGAVMTAWAKLWADRMAKEVATYYLSIDVHLPAKLRANFTIAQQDEFYKAFNIQSGDGMYTAPEDRINIW